MPRVTVPDKTVGDVFTEQMWDAYIRDNFNIGSWTPIVDTILGVSAANIDWQSIPATFAHLAFELYDRGDAASANQALFLRFNNDSGANYDYEVQTTAATTVTGSEGLAQTSARIGQGPANTAPANVFSGLTAWIEHYSGSTNQKCGHAHGSDKSGTGTGNIIIEMDAFFWRSAAAINRITIFPQSGNFVAGTRATLYGIPYI